MTDIALPDRMPVASEATRVEQARAVAEVAAAVQVAQSFPRDEIAAAQAMRDLCSRLAVAQRAFYAVPNRGSGMSVHIARELARIWGNTDYGVKELRRDDVAGVSEIQAFAWDMQTNVRSTRHFVVPHARDTKAGRKPLVDLADIYLNNQNVGARAVRECIFGMLPDWFLHDAEQALKHTLEVGDGKPIQQRRENAVAAFESEFRVSQAQLEARLQKAASRWQPADLAELSKIRTSIVQDGIPVAEFFPEAPVTVAELTAPAPSDADLSGAATDPADLDKADPGYRATAEEQE